jgi:hypothetical protein
MTFKNFTLEGEVILGYHADEMSDRDRGIKMISEETGEPASLEGIIARSLEFPSDDEFETHFARMSQLRDQELQPLDGSPDVTRTGVKLRITVSVVED